MSRDLGPKGKRIVFAPAAQNEQQPAIPKKRPSPPGSGDPHQSSGEKKRQCRGLAPASSASFATSQEPTAANCDNLLVQLSSLANLNMLLANQEKIGLSNAGSVAVTGPLHNLLSIKVPLPIFTAIASISQADAFEYRRALQRLFGNGCLLENALKKLFLWAQSEINEKKTGIPSKVLAALESPVMNDFFANYSFADMRALIFYSTLDSSLQAIVNKKGVAFTLRWVNNDAVTVPGGIAYEMLCLAKYRPISDLLEGLKRAAASNISKKSVNCLINIVCRLMHSCQLNDEFVLPVVGNLQRIRSYKNGEVIAAQFKSFIVEIATRMEPAFRENNQSTQPSNGIFDREVTESMVQQYERLPWRSCAPHEPLLHSKWLQGRFAQFKAKCQEDARADKQRAGALDKQIKELKGQNASLQQQLSQAQGQAKNAEKALKKTRSKDQMQRDEVASLQQQLAEVQAKMALCLCRFSRIVEHQGTQINFLESQLGQLNNDVGTLQHYGGSLAQVQGELAARLQVAEAQAAHFKERAQYVGAKAQGQGRMPIRPMGAPDQLGGRAGMWRAPGQQPRQQSVVTLPLNVRWVGHS